MGYRLNRLDEPVFIAVSKPLLTEFDIHQRLESCEGYWLFHKNKLVTVRKKQDIVSSNFTNKMLFMVELVPVSQLPTT